MKWNWQKADWPHFSYNKAKLADLEARALRDTGVLLGAQKHLDEDQRITFIVNLICDEALKTSAIEGEMLSRESLQSSIRKQFGLVTPSKKIPKAEQGISELMLNLHSSFSNPLDHGNLFTWHRMVSKGREDLKDIGCYRAHSEPMQVVSFQFSEPKIHFEAPPSSQMQKEMNLFLTWFNESGPGGKAPLPLLTRAGIAHLYFVCIHPFEDGNGRIGRALSEKAMAQCFGQPTLIALSSTIEKHRASYYEELERANKSNDITGWLIYFGKTVLESLSYTQAQIEFLIQKTKLFDRVRDQLNDRQEKALTRMLAEGPDGFKGGLSAENYIRITKTSRATATRDLKDLVKKGALIEKGKLRHTRYYLKLI